MKKCSICGVDKDDSDFYKRKERLRAECKDCVKLRIKRYAQRNESQISDKKKRYYLDNRSSIRESRASLRREKRDIIESIKRNPCYDCGKTYPSCAMDFDHKFDKKYGISRILNTPCSVETLRTELSKCDLVCACCHRDRTHSRKRKNNKRRYPSRDLKRGLINDQKNNPCVECGESFHPWQMDFDHINGVKRFKLSAAPSTSVSVEEISEEIAKCELVCVNCHRVRTEHRGNHGNKTGDCSKA